MCMDDLFLFDDDDDKETDRQPLSKHQNSPTLTHLHSYIIIGLIKWEKGRADWHAMKLKKIQEQAGSSSTTPDHLRQSLPLDVDEIIDIIFSPRWRMAGAETGPPKRFPQNVPLVQMVDVLVDLWEAEGLDM